MGTIRKIRRANRAANRGAEKGGKGIGALLLVALLFLLVIAVAVYVVAAACIGAGWAAVESRRRRKGRPHVEPRTRFYVVWTRAVSPHDQSNWVAPEMQPATDPQLLPGEITGSMQIEPVGMTRVHEDGPREWVTLRARIRNHSSSVVALDDVDTVDVQLWSPSWQLVDADIRWSETPIGPGEVRDVDIAMRVIDGQQVAWWAISHRPADYAWIPVRELSTV